MLNAPINDDWSFRLAAESMRSDKNITYSDPANSEYDEDSYDSIRGKLLYDPLSIPELSVLFTISDVTDSPAVTAVNGDPADRHYDATQSAIEYRENDVTSYILDINYELTEEYALQSITSRVDTKAYLDGSGTISGSAYLRDELRADEDYSQEFRVIKQPGFSPLSGVAGVYYGNFKNDRDSLVTLEPEPIQSLSSKNQDTSLGLFAQARWEFNSKWTGIVGARYNRDTSDTEFEDYLDKTKTTSEYESDSFLPNVGVIYSIDELSNIAFTVSQGYRSGFYEEGRAIDPEYLTSYELAYRALLADEKLQLSANTFFYDWQDQQITVTQGSAQLPYTENAGQSNVYGLELDARYYFDTVTIGSSIGLLKTELTDYKSELTSINYSGNEFPEAPEFSGSLWANARIAEYWFVSGDLSGRSSAYATSDLSNTHDKVSGYGLVNLRAGYERDIYSIVASVDNLFDKEYITGRDTLGGVYVGDERTFAVTFSASY